MSRTLGDPTFGGPGYKVVEQVLATIDRYEMFEGGESVLVAFSGGPDSTCLLDVLARLRGKLGLKLAVAHVDHGLSERSGEIAAKVSTAVAEAGFEIHLVRIPDLAGPNLHARARDFRYGFLDMVTQKEGVDLIATGHTLDDRVETTLARLVHGAGTKGLIGIPPADDNRVRPLIELRRGETRTYCEECGLDFHEDPANEDLRFERTAVRTQLVAAIEERWGDGAIRAIAQSIDRLSQDEQALSDIAIRLWETEVGEHQGNAQKIALPIIQRAPRAIRRRILEQMVGQLRDRNAGIDAALDAMDRPITQEARFSLPKGAEITITPELLTVRRHRMD